MVALLDFQLCQNVVDVTHQFKDIFVYPDRAMN